MFANKLLKLRLILSLLLLLSANSILALNTTAQTAIELTTEQYQELDDQIQQLLTQAQQQQQLGKSQDAIATIQQALILTEKFNNYDQASHISTIMSDFEQWGDPIVGLEIIKPYQKEARKDPYILSVYDQIAANLVIKLVTTGKLDQGETWTETIKSPYPQAQAYNAIATELIKQQQTEKAQEILAKTTKIAQNIHESYESNGSCANYRFEILSQIAANLSKLAQIKQALTIAETIESCSSASGESGQTYQENSYSAILESVTTKEQLDLIKDSSSKITQDIEKAAIWSAIALKYIELGDTDTAYAIAQDISKNIPTVTKIESGADYRALGVKEQALRDISLALDKSGASSQALDVANMIEPPTPN